MMTASQARVTTPQTSAMIVFKRSWRTSKCQEERDRQEHEALADDDNNALLFLVRAGTIDGSKFYDSGFGSSLPPASSYAETIMSYGGGDGRSVRVPPLPLEGKAGKPFACVACGRSVLISNNSAWKQHLYADLCPWLCLDSSCPYGDKLFNNRNDWVSHLALDHGLEPGWGSFKCPLCHNDTGVGKLAITKHLGGHLEEISLGALPSGLDFESESDGESQDDEDIHADVSIETEHNTTLDNPAVSPSKNAQDTTDPLFHATEVVDEESYTIKCVCDFSSDDGNTIYCETCDTWQHIKCYYPNDTEDVYNDNFDHSCIDCNPRPIDLLRVIELQKGMLRETDKDTNLDNQAPRTPFNPAQVTNPSGNNEPTALRSITTSHNEDSPKMPSNSADSQPILNDALEYLDRVKMTFADQPDVYNRFLDILKDFRDHVIDTPGVINRITELFVGRRSLIDGFNTFLPPGYAIVCNEDNGKNTIRVSTPTGTVIQKPSGQSALVDEISGDEHATVPLTSGEANQEALSPGHHNFAPLVVQSDARGVQGITFEYFRDRVKMKYTIRTDIKSVNVETLSPKFKTDNCVYPNAYHNQDQGRGSHQSEYNAFGWALAELDPVIRGKRGLIQKAVSSWMNSPQSRSTGPVEFNQSIGYVNKVKDRFRHQPEKYKQFLDILQTYQRESKPIQSVYEQFTALFADAPELLEDFKQFLPESAVDAVPEKTGTKVAE